MGKSQKNMKILLVSVFLLALASKSLSQTIINDTSSPDQFGGNDDLEFGPSEQPSETANLAASVISSILSSEAVQNKLARIYDLIDLKIRFVKLINSLLTRENFILVRRILDLIVRVCNFFIAFLPDDTPTPPAAAAGPSFLESLFPVVQLNVAESNNEPVTQQVDVNNNSTNNNNNNDVVAVTRVNRNASLSDEERKLIEEHKDDVVQLAKLIYKTP